MRPTSIALPSSRILAQCGLALLLSLAAASRAQARIPVPFGLDYCCDRAALIVVGKLDAKDVLSIDETLFGDPGDNKTIALPDGTSKALRKAMKTADDAAIQVAAFLDKDRKLAIGPAALIGFSQQDVYLHEPSQMFRDELEPVRHPTLTRDKFFASVRTAIALTAERREILAVQPSSERCRRILNYLQKTAKEVPPPGMTGFGGDYPLGQVAKAMSPVHPDEEARILRELRETQDAAWRVRLLMLAGSIPLTNNAFEIVANWIGKEYPQLPRETAMNALGRINGDWATERFLGQLSLDDASLAVMLDNLRSVSLGRNSDAWLRNPRTVDALLKLKQELPPWKPADAAQAQKVYTALRHAMYANFHPRLLPALIAELEAQDADRWGIDSALQNLTGVKFPHENPEPLRQWWRASQAVLERKYDLSRDQGVSDWLDAVERADEPTRKVLNRLWLFERAIPERYLVEETGSDDAARAAIAKTTLAHLWDYERLTPETMGLLIERFLKVELTEVPVPPGSGGARHLQLTGQRSFPFPEVWPQYATDWTVGEDRTPQLGHGWSSRSLKGEGPIEFGNMSGGQFYGAPNARVSFAIRLYDYRNRQVIWSHRQDFGPMKLRNIDQPKK